MPSIINSDFSNTDESYLEIFNDTILNNKTTKKVLVWTTFFKNMHWESEIKQKMLSCNRLCEVTSDRNQIKDADALLFHHGDLNENDLPPSRFLHQPWILFTLEPTTLISGNLNWWGKIFNWTMSYRTYSTIFNPYGYFINKTMIPVSNKLDVGFKGRVNDMFAVISRCHDDARRYKIIHELTQHFEVDTYGACSSNKLKCNYTRFYCIPPTIIKKYKFRLAFENSNCRDYITEKYWDSLQQNVVPIVNWKDHQRNDFSLEGLKQFESENMNVIPNSYINIYDFDNIINAVKFITEVGENETLYNSFHEWKKIYTPVSSMYSGFCRLCDKLHKPFTAQVYKDLEKWFKDDTCGKNNVSLLLYMTFSVNPIFRIVEDILSPNAI